MFFVCEPQQQMKDQFDSSTVKGSYQPKWTSVNYSIQLEVIDSHVTKHEKALRKETISTLQYVKEFTSVLHL